MSSVYQAFLSSLFYIYYPHLPPSLCPHSWHSKPSSYSSAHSTSHSPPPALPQNREKRHINSHQRRYLNSCADLIRMEYEFFDPTNQTHMELVNMVMQMESMPEFSEIPPPSVIDFSGGSMPSHAFRGGAPPSATMLPPVVANPSSTNSSVGGQAATVHNNSYPSANCGGINTTRLGGGGDVNRASIATMREMIFRIAAMQPVHIDPEAVKPPKRRNVKISKDPQSVAARHRRERISERIRILQRLVPGGTKMDTASMLDEAIHYVKFLKTQVQSLERVAANRSNGIAGGFSGPENYWLCGHHHHHHQSTYQ